MVGLLQRIHSSLLTLQCSLCGASMTNLANPGRIGILLILVLCCGCVRGMFLPVGQAAATPAHAPVAQAASASSVPAPVAQAQPVAPIMPPLSDPPTEAWNPVKKPRVFEPDGIADYTYHNATVTEDVAWSGKVSVRGVLTIAPQATLTIGPGTIVTFRPDDSGTVDGALLVQGRLNARGSASQPVLFRPATRTAGPGDWQGILLLGSEKKNLLEQCRIEGAATGLDAVFSSVSLNDSQISASGTGVRLRDSLLVANGGGTSGCGLGYALVNSEADVRNAKFTGNARGLLLSGGSLLLAGSRFSANSEVGVEAEDARLSVARSSFTGNGSGLVLKSTEGDITASNLSSNREFGVKLTRARMRLSGNVISNNTGVGVLAEDGYASAWGNDISSNGKYDLYNGGREEFLAPGNWWGSPLPSVARKRIFDREDDPRSGAVLIEPCLAAAPGP